MHRAVLASFACAVPAAVFALFAVPACSSGSHHAAGGGSPDAADATSQPDVGAAEAEADGGGDELTVSDECGSPPYVTLGIVVVALTLDDPDGAPLAGAQFTSPLCPGIAEYSDDAGVIQGVVSQNVPFYGRLEAPDYIPELAPEEIFDASSTGHRIDMLPLLLEGVLLPGFEASTQTAIVIAAQKVTDDGGACSSFDGISFSVPGHPEAQVVYFTNDAFPVVIPDGGATSARGLAVITGLDAGQLVTLAGTKPGCQVLFQVGTLTGRVPLENGFVSLMPAYVSP
ncbi:MAG TPA: hypothetical protein VIY73_08300 [Polyangiaceae bacterium]